MRQTETNRLLNKTRKDLVEIIDDLQRSLARWKDDPVEDPPFYWMIGYMGWGSAEDEVDFLDGGDTNPTAQMAVDAWEILRQESNTRASDPNYDDTPQLLVYRIDEVGRASTDKRWLFKPKKG